MVKFCTLIGYGKFQNNDKWPLNGVWSGSGKGKGFPYSLPSVGPGADPGVQAVSLQVATQQ